ncbi:MAG: Rpn family recombination-promoting nuclease/putative transposase, partial [Candidatus Delongbacteria bacterium]|nr:Rpn family recombination-promoting nuclease/putative transposase [Candidatus Delongbacteria bacterium]
MCRINPKIDIAFKKLFGSEENKDILKSFINSVLPAHEQVKNLELKNPYNLATYISGKSGILDVKAQAENGVWFDVEMQIGEQLFFGKRIKYYLDKMYVDQLDISEKFSTLKKVVGIAILDFNYFPDERYKRGITYKDIDTDERYENFNLSDIYFIELKKFGKDLKHLTDTLDRWITFLNKAHEYNRNNIPKELSVDIDV